MGLVVIKIRKELYKWEYISIFIQPNKLLNKSNRKAYLHECNLTYLHLCEGCRCTVEACDRLLLRQCNIPH